MTSLRTWPICVLVLSFGCASPPPPAVEIVAPEPGVRLPSTPQTNFSGAVTPVEGSLFDVAMQWQSSQEGDLGEGRFAPGGGVEVQGVDLTPGALTITLSVTTPEGGFGSDSAEYAVNHPPTAPTIAISATEITTTGAVTATVVTPSEDVEGDPITYDFQWSREGASSGFAGATLSGATMRRGQTWSVSASAHDGYDAGGRSNEIHFTRVNAPPSAPGVLLEPETPTVGVDDLKCVLAAPSIDDDGDALSYTITWDADGQAYPSELPSASGPHTDELEGDTVPAADLGLATRFTCTIIAFDGIDASPPGSASAEPTQP